MVRRPPVRPRADGGGLSAGLDTVAGLSAASLPVGDRTAASTSGALSVRMPGLQTSAGNGAVVQMLRGSGHPSTGALRSPAQAHRPVPQPAHTPATSVVQRQDAPKRKVSGQAARRLQYAQHAVDHTKTIIRDAANQMEGLEHSKFNSYARLLVTRINEFWDYSQLDHHPDYHTMVAARAAHLRSGDCGDHAALTFAYLRRHAVGERIRYCGSGGAEHYFVLIGESGEPDHEVAVADPWPTRAKACLWDDYFAYTSAAWGLTTEMEMVADGKDDVDLVRSQISLNRAGQIVAQWNLDVVKERGVDGIARSLIRNGIDLGPSPSARAVLRGLKRFSDIDPTGVEHWSEDKLHLWCASQVDSAVLEEVLAAQSTHRRVIHSGIREAHEDEGLRWVRAERTASAPGREFKYVKRWGH